MTFADSTIRKIIFPYPEDADYEDLDRPPHWLANIRFQALGLEGRRSESSRHRPSRSADYHEALWTSFGGTDDESSGEGDDDGVYIAAAARTSSGTTPLDLPKIQPSQPVQGTSSTDPASSPRPTFGLQSRSRSSQPQLPHGEQVGKGRSTQKPAALASTVQSEARRHHRHHSLPSPLTPAQPLVQVNTFLPLRIPPPDLRAKSPLAYPASFYFAEQPNGEEDQVTAANSQRNRSQSRRRAHRRERTSPSTRTSISSLLDSRGRTSSSSSSSSSLESKASVYSVESDGSFHGDAGDEDPESQLAAGIAKLKREQQWQTQRAAAAARKVEQQANVKATRVPTVNEDDDDMRTARQIEEHAGLMTSLADLVLGLKVTRTGEAFRHRSASYTDVQDLKDYAPRALHSNNVHLSRTQSADALEESWSNAKRPNPTATSSSSLFSSGVSTPYELRDEVVRWSRRRRDAARSSRSLTTSPPSYTSTLLDYIPFASALKTRLAQLQSITTIAEVSDDGDLAGMSHEDDEQVIDHKHAAALARHASEHLHNGENEDEGDETPSLTTTQDDAFSSLWASPITSRASSHYNLKILSDEPSAFEEHSAESSVGAWRSQSRYVDPNSLRFTRLNGQGAEGSLNGTVRKSKSTFHGVSPLWAENHTDDEADTSPDDLTSSKPAYTRSWSSVLGMAA